MYVIGGAISFDSTAVKPVGSVTVYLCVSISFACVHACGAVLVLWLGGELRRKSGAHR